MARKKKSTVTNQVDTIFNKKVFIDGKQIGGVLGWHCKFDYKKKNYLTEVTVRFAIKKNSLRIEDISGSPAMQKVSFSTLNDGLQMDNLDYAEWIANRKGLV